MRRKTTFAGQVAIVTGGASGIGYALSREFIARGGRVIIADINLQAAQESADKLGDRASSQMLDVTDAGRVQSVIDDTVRTSGAVDYYFNNAGIEISGEVKNLDVEHWQRPIDINLMGVIHGTRLAYARMIEQGHGHIVNIASGAGLVMFPTSIPYTTAKAGVVGLTRALAAEAEAYGVHVTLVCPGMVHTGIFDAAVSIGPSIKDFTRRLPGRIIDADRAANIILDGIAAGKPEITFPVENILGAWLVNALPWFGRKLRRDIVRKFREMDAES